MNRLSLKNEKDEWQKTAKVNFWPSHKHPGKQTLMDTLRAHPPTHTCAHTMVKVHIDIPSVMLVFRMMWRWGLFTLPPS